MMLNLMKSAIARFLMAFGILLVAVASLGCGETGPTRYQVSGTVSYDGKPVPAGRITFEPDTSQGNTGPAGWGKIQAGKFTTEKGVIGGPHIVRITGRDGVPVQLDTGEAVEGTLLFPEYVETISLPMESASRDFTVPTE